MIALLLAKHGAADGAKARQVTLLVEGSVASWFCSECWSSSAGGLPVPRYPDGSIDQEQLGLDILRQRTWDPHRLET